MKIKTFLTIIIFFYLAFDVGWAQPYESIFKADTVQWNFYEYTTGSEYTLIYKILDEIDIDSITYKIIYSYGCGKNGNELCDIEGYIREDTLSGKGFFRYPKKDKEYIVWDFSLEKGDTFLLELFNIKTSINIDSTNIINGRKHIYTNFYFPKDLGTALHLDVQTVTFIEGIGSTNGLIYLTQSLSSYLLCSYKNEILIYSGHDNCLVFNVEIKKVREDNILFVKKINENFIFSSIDNQFLNIKIDIYNIQGQFIESIISNDQFIEYSPKISNSILIYKLIINGKIYSGLLL